MDTHLISSIVTLLLIACVVGIAARWLKQPYTIALVLVGLPADFAYRELFLIAAFAIVLFSLVIQGMTMKPLIKYFTL